MATASSWRHPNDEHAGWTPRRSVLLGVVVAGATANSLAGLLGGAHSAFDGLSRLAMLAGVAVLLATHQALRRERLLARRDALTGLFNRRAFFEVAAAEMGRARRRELPVTLAYVDCDHFKQVNDGWGHQAGDRVLREVAAALTGAIRESDLVARIGGDEFVVLLPGVKCADAHRIVAALQARLLEAMRQGGWPVTFSIGATWSTAPGRVDTLLRRADELMYEAKRGGRNAARCASA